MSATGTWDKPFRPAYPDRATFARRQLHTADHHTSNDLAGAHVVVIGGGASAVQLLIETS